MSATSHYSQCLQHHIIVNVFNETGYAEAPSRIPFPSFFFVSSLFTFIQLKLSNETWYIWLETLSFFLLQLYPLRHFIVFLICLYTEKFRKPFSLRTGSDDWQKLLSKIGIPADSARAYGKAFMEESITKDSLTKINREVLKELGVTTMGHALGILKLAKEQPLTLDGYTKAPAVRPPQLHSGMTSQQFRKFRIDWEVFV